MSTTIHLDSISIVLWEWLVLLFCMYECMYVCMYECMNEWVSGEVRWEFEEREGKWKPQHGNKDEGRKEGSCRGKKGNISVKFYNNLQYRLKWQPFHIFTIIFRHFLIFLSLSLDVMCLLSLSSTSFITFYLYFFLRNIKFLTFLFLLHFPFMSSCFFFFFQ